MDPTRHLLAAKIFLATCDMPDTERHARVASACGGDAELESMVLELLRGESATGFFDATSTLVGAASERPESFPERIGPYRIVRCIGRGGMGIVFEAEQDHPRRSVALKVIRAGITDDLTRRRFETEAQILGRLQHSGIAQIFEAGSTTTEFGIQPYFAMELVEGVSLDRFIRERAPDVEDRVRLIVRICDALEHAHQKGVVHRDLKPSNILVDRSGQPKVLDFGVARLADADGGHVASLRTSEGEIVGTLAYMSPEQASGRSDEVDHRSDVYALGLIAYEILVERRALDLSGRSLTEAIRAVHEETPRPLGSIAPRLAGDLETIIGKAIAKEKERRYAGAAALADDLLRYLADEPVLARPPSSLYLVAKFTRRHRALVLGLGGAILALVAGLAATLWQAHERGRAEAAAKEEAELTKAFSRFLLLDVLRPADAWREGSDIEVQDVLDRAEAAIEGRFAGHEEIEADVRDALGMSYLAQGAFEKAQRHVQAAYEGRRRTRGDDDPSTVEAASHLAAVLIVVDQADRALPLATHAYDAMLATRGARHPETLAAMHTVAQAHRKLGDVDAAIDWMQRAAELRRAVLGEGSVDTHRSLSALAGFLHDRGRPREATEILRNVWETTRAARGDDAPDAIIARSDLASMLIRAGELPEAESILRELVEAATRVFGENDDFTARTRLDHANALIEAERLDEAEAEIVRAATTFESRFGPSYEGVLRARFDLVKVLLRQGRFDRALELAEENVERSKADPARLAVHVDQLGTVLRRRGDLDAAVANHARAIDLLRSAFDGPHQAIALALYHLGVASRERADHAGALAAFEQLAETKDALYGPDRNDACTDLANVAEPLNALGRHLEAVEIAGRAVDIARSRFGEVSGAYARAALELGVAAAALGRNEEAEPLLLATHRYVSGRRGLRDPHLRRAADALHRVYLALGRPDDARAYAQAPDD